MQAPNPFKISRPKYTKPKKDIKPNQKDVIMNPELSRIDDEIQDKLGLPSTKNITNLENDHYGLFSKSLPKSVKPKIETQQVNAFKSQVNRKLEFDKFENKVKTINNSLKSQKDDLIKILESDDDELDSKIKHKAPNSPMSYSEIDRLFEDDSDDQILIKNSRIKDNRHQVHSEPKDVVMTIEEPTSDEHKRTKTHLTKDTSLEPMAVYLEYPLLLFNR